MIELTLPATPEGKAAAREVIDALDSAQLDYEAWEEDDESVSFDFDDSDQDAVMDVMRGLGIDVEPTREDDPQSGDPMYRTEQMIEAVVDGADPSTLLSESVSPEDLAQLKQHADRYGGIFKYSNPTRTLFKFKRPADADGFAKDVEKIFKLKSQKDYAGSMVSVWK
jgi:hypothetical protein